MDSRIENIDELRSKVVNLALMTFASLGILNDIFSFFRAKEYGFWWLFILQSIVILYLVAIAAFRKKISLEIKIYSFAGIIFTLLITGLYSLGFLASSKILIAILPVFISFIGSYRKGLITLLLFLAIYAMFTCLYSFGIIEYSYNLNDYATNIRTWIQDYVVIFLTSWGLLYVSSHFVQALTENYIKIKKQNLEITEKEKKYRTLFECSNDSIILIKNKCFFDCNAVAFRLFQCDREFIIGKEPHLFSPEFQPDGQNSQEKADALFYKANNYEPVVFDWQHKRPNDELFDVSISLNLIEFDDEKYMMAVLRDITEKKKIEKELELYRNNLEQMVKEQTSDLKAKNEELHTTLNNLKNTQSQLIQSEKMASLGILTAGVAHEINNPLNFIMGGYFGFEQYFNENSHLKDEKNQYLLNSIKTGVDRASDIVKGLNQFSRNNDSLNEVCDIHSIINNCLLMLQDKIEDKIEVINDFANEPIIVNGNVGKMHQVFINILLNSIQSISEKGTITIKTFRLEKEIKVEISDSGIGISKENLTKITDPFFTTKEPGKGTGIGLSIVYKIIQDHMGKIEFQSKLNLGTIVKISLPDK